MKTTANIILVCFLLLICSTSIGQTTAAIDSVLNTKKQKIKLKYEPSIEYLTPTHDYRSIQTISGNLLLGLEFFKKTPLSIYGGITATYAWGTIKQLDSNFNNVTYKNNAWGIGPVFLLRYQIPIYKGVSLSPDFSGGLIFYSTHFPYGGDFYNFMWRMGGAIHYRINKTYDINLNAKWMHVSNGQGPTQHNPSYEAWGIGIGFTKYLGSYFYFKNNY